MTIKKLQKIVTCPVKASFKAKWLHWWNALLRERLDNKFFVDKPMRKKALDDWLHKAFFRAQVHQSLGFFILTCVYSIYFIANHLPHCSWRRKFWLKLKPLRGASPSTLIGTRLKLSCVLVSTLIIGGLSFGIEPLSLTLAISLTSPLPKVISSWSSRKGP
jgi:hypothetical protein